ncbi:RNA-directed DNA polymerase, eukaryota, reverse transcriptase zinc-binding domain protein [Tanacetum coccineum]
MDTPNKVSDFRPIACCNVLYKCISKILTNRIKDGLSKVISLNQSAFIPGRHIQDNILIAQELLKGYNRKNGAKRCAMKIDIQKAYDTNIAADPSFKYHHGCKELKLTHMCFADDLMILCNGDSNSLKVIQKSLDEFSNASGLFPNLGKLPMTLIASVLSSMQQYRASVYIIPISAVKELDKMFKRFLWNSGIKPLKKWNETLLVSQLWKIIENRESLWVKWVNTVKLKGSSIWNIEGNQSDSWGWGQLMMCGWKCCAGNVFRGEEPLLDEIWGYNPHDDALLLISLLYCGCGLNTKG